MSGDIESDSGNSETERIVVANGMDFDKRYFYEVSKRMSRDWGLRRLSLLGPPIWIIASVVAALISLRLLGPGTLADILGAIVNRIPVSGLARIFVSSPEPIYLLTTIVTIAAVIAWFIKPIGAISLTLIVSWVYSIVRSIRRILEYFLNAHPDQS